MGIDPNARVRELLDCYDRADASAAWLLCDRHPADAVAFTIIDSDLSSTDLTYGQLRAKSERFAAALARLGVEPGDRVATLMAKSEDLVVALLGIWRRGAVHVPLFTAFAPPAIAFRLTASGASIVIADPDQAGKLAPGDDIPADPPWRTIVTGDEPAPGALRMRDLVAADADIEPAVAVGGDGLLVQLFTSGTTGTPKGVPIPVRALASFHAYQEFALDVRPDDVFWNAADPGWAYGLYYAILGPLASGTRSLLLHAGFSPALTWQVIDRFGVTNFAAAPTVYRALRADSAAPPKVRLRRASSAGEPLTPEVVAWSADTLGVAVRDHYGQTEHGMVICNAWHDELNTEAPAGSMGRSLPGWACAVLADDADTEAPTGQLGRIAIDTERSPLLWFLGYLDAPERTAQRYTPDGRWYLTGDAGSQDADGFFHFSARDDDVIIMAGYRIGPFEVESVLVLHEDVAEAAVVGMPDELRGEVLEAFVVVREGVAGSAELEAELQTLVKKKFAAHAYPRRVHFVPSLPKTPSGKVQRFLLRQQEVR
ncbi:AMP-binding protein [Nocardia cyriacigeorgica]|uniref:AMP-binding protein n=1 Tax=Nocardia cyriacigeorgica TaxID=135487 RepID=UPI001894E839|nr:AMP-binding protein [Nocardia cyriacigeorgica]MBF6101838.1 AMP-binding protein [Nocardia cyriacigeorgica]MBF6158691.1 AMP-binding protein [Nocardia cyriacigeorgica]MBF6197622.1 AMP-binding protein [Nocardia cyriacigeorgica]MBF6344977.1 AMP-binding protein [Nocardia cyriacigeorgica]MBF6517319.1 AMP-binding protein [Nocardia cyriacigeorgica]